MYAVEKETSNPLSLTLHGNVHDKAGIILIIVIWTSENDKVYIFENSTVNS